MSDLDLAKASIFIAVTVLVACGYFLGISKPVFEPKKSLIFLGFLSDSVKQAFILPEDKKEKFAALRDQLLSSKTISVRSLQKFAGKVVSFSLAVPTARLYTREVNACISRGLRRSKMTKELHAELLHWKFLDSWSGFSPWRQERHFTVNIYSDASNSGWGGILSLPNDQEETRDYWSVEEKSASIAFKEAKALYNTLKMFSNAICNGRIDAYVDNSNLLNFWQNCGGKNTAMNNEIKLLFDLPLKLNIVLNIAYVPSASNPADAPSRVSSDKDCCLTDESWKLLECSFGPHTFDLMAIPSNVRKCRDGNSLPFFSPFPCSTSSGVNVFAQQLSGNENYYIFPPFSLIGPLLRFMKDSGIKVTLIAPEISPKQYWWPILVSISAVKFQIGEKGQKGILLSPPNKSLSWHSKALSWNLWAFRIFFLFNFLESSLCAKNLETCCWLSFMLLSQRFRF